MKSLLKNFLLITTLFSGFFMIPNITKSYAMGIGLGAKVGYSFSYDSYNPSMIFFYMENNNKFSHGLSANIFVDLRLSDSFSIVPAVNATFNKRHDFFATYLHEDRSEEERTVRMQFHTLELELLIKMSYDLFFMAGGVSVGYNTAPKITVSNSAGQINEQFESSGKIGFNLVGEIGIHYALGYYEDHTILVSIRTSFSPLNARYWLDPLSGGTKSSAATIASGGIFVGYAYYFG